MSATEELRAMLDELGVRWDYGPSGASSTAFWVNGKELSFSNCRDGLVCSTIFTPVQAVVATLGDSDATQTRQDDATKQLRAMLDERGVKWRKWDYFGIDMGTIFSASGIEWIVIWDPKANNLSIANYKINHTAEQIITATLGNKTCREVKVTTKPNMWGFDDYFCGHCGRRLTSVANGLNEHFPVYCEDCGTKAVYE